MKTYQTIQEAFKNGTGDVFFFMGGEAMQYIALSRHVDHDSTMFELGFDRLTYDEVVLIATKEQAERQHNIEKKVAKAINKSGETINGFIHISCSPFDGFYDEFPDAYGQNL
jgi:hypothetical protein